MNENQNFRMAALKLHALHPKDRAWLLAHFEPSQQGILGTLIRELDDLGFVSTENVSNHLANYPVGHFQLDANIVAEINQARPEVVMKSLNALPERLMAMVLHAARWQWSSSIWLQLEQHERQRLLRQITQFGEIKAPVFIALIESFAEMLKQEKPSVTLTPRVAQSKDWDK